MKKLLRPFLKWRWHDASQSWRLQLTWWPWGDYRATVWPNGHWHTWDENGTGAENGIQRFHGQEIFSIKAEAYESAIRQGFI